MTKYLILLFLPVTIHANVSAQTIREDNGKVGIGLDPTAGISATLEVGGTIMGRGTIASVFSSEGGGQFNLVNPTKNTPGIASTWAIFNMTGGYGNSLQFWAYDNWGCGSGLCNNRFTIMDNGNVGIGTQTPAARLTVAGGILATKIKVNQNLTWPDYVFEPTYQLLSLYQLEQFIRQNKHLPDVPSAETIAREGLDLGDNQAALLKKIEELTLYMIELKKEVDELRKRVDTERK